MITKYYKCTLDSDIVLNSSLNTQGNMSSLDYIPGSNFLGIVASKLYQKPENNDFIFPIIHGNKVSFGDATISKNNLISYSVPFDFMIDKIEKSIGEDPIYVHHGIKERPKKRKSESIAQLKQLREGYLLSDYQFIKEVEKSFSLKSAQDRNTRASKEGQMFGFDSIQKGQEFIFSIIYQDEAYINIVESNLIGLNRLGKSKNAEFGQVNIESIDTINTIPSSTETRDYLLVYAQSNLYFTDEFGSATFQPNAADLGLEGEIKWELSQLRSFSYSPWNSKRNTTSTQRHCIAKGSVFYVKTTVKTEKSTAIVGAYQNEGLGRIIYNPTFLDCKENGEIVNAIKKYEEIKPLVNKKEPTSKLALFLMNKFNAKQEDLKISEEVASCIEELKAKKSPLIEISSSQWGGIRAYAAKTKNQTELKNLLFGSDEKVEKVGKDDKVQVGYLTHGIAEERYWGKKGNLRVFQDIFELGDKFSKSSFIEKFAAEMAKENKRFEGKKK